MVISKECKKQEWSKQYTAGNPFQRGQREDEGYAGRMMLKKISSSSVICQTTGPKSLPKWFLHIVRSRASSFNWQHPLLSLRSSSSFLRQSAKARVVWSYRKNARNKNRQSNTLLETHFKEANRKTKDTLGEWC